MLTAEETAIIERTYRQLSFKLIQAGELFYDTLFERFPQVKPMFHTPRSEQGLKLMQTIGFAVTNLHNPDALRPIVQGLGKRHVDYGVSVEHYNWVGDALLATLEILLKDEFTVEVREAWAKLYTMLAEQATSALKSES